MVPYILYPLIIFVVDLLWLAVSQSMVSRMILNIQKSSLTIRIIPGLIVYGVLSYLITIPKTTTGAFLLGASTYAVYDFTNYATIKNYDLTFAVMDTLWGGVLFAIVFIIIHTF